MTGRATPDHMADVRLDQPPINNRAEGLRLDPSDPKMVAAAERDVWTRTLPIRCYYEDGRGRCSSRETRPEPIWEDGAYLRVDYLCRRHHGATRS